MRILVADDESTWKQGRRFLTYIIHCREWGRIEHDTTTNGESLSFWLKASFSKSGLKH